MLFEKDLRLAVVIFEKTAGGNFSSGAVIEDHAIELNYDDTMVFARNKLKFSIMNLDPELATKWNRMIIGMPIQGKNTRPDIYGAVFAIKNGQYIKIGAKRMLKIDTTLSGDMNVTSKTTFEGYTGILGNNVLGSVEANGTLLDVLRKTLDVTGRTTVNMGANNEFKKQIDKQAAGDFSFSGSLDSISNFIIQEMQTNKGVIKDEVNFTQTSDINTVVASAKEEVYINYKDTKMGAKAGISLTDEDILGDYNPLAGEFVLSIQYTPNVNVGDFVSLSSNIRPDLNGNYKILSININIQYDPLKPTIDRMNIRVSKKILAFLKG